jgi:hypothetical protein
MITLIILIINMANIEPQQTIHTQKFTTKEQCESVGKEILLMEYEQLQKRGALNKDKKNYQISFKCVK